MVKYLIEVKIAAEHPYKLAGQSRCFWAV